MSANKVSSAESAKFDTFMIPTLSVGIRRQALSIIKAPAGLCADHWLPAQLLTWVTSQHEALLTLHGVETEHSSQKHGKCHHSERPSEGWTHWYSDSLESKYWFDYTVGVVQNHSHDCKYNCKKKYFWQKWQAVTGTKKIILQTSSF